MRPERTELGEAEAIFADFLERYHEGRAGIEDLCRDHPQHATRLRRWWQRLEAAGELDRTKLPAMSAEPSAPETLDDFRLLREIGRGGMGVVYEAEDLVLHRRVAVKILPEGRRLFGESMRRFEREIAALSRLTHPHIVTVHRSGLDRERPYLVMEYVRGKSLEDVLQSEREITVSRRRPSSVIDPHVDGDVQSDGSGSTSTSTRESDKTYFGVVARLVAETAEALEHAHRHGVLHRDVKPGNILIDERGSARLVDFGVARILGEESLTVTGGFAGTPSYAAPEQVSENFGEPDGRTDVYALGVVLYELITGRRPFTDSDTRRMLNRVLTEIPPEARRIEGTVPWELSVICAKAMEKRPERRYPTAAAMAADLRAYLTHRPISARPPTWTRRVRIAAQRHPWISGVIVAAVVLVIAFVSFDVYRDLREHANNLGNAEQSLAQIPGLLGEIERKSILFAERWDELARLREIADDRPLSEEERERKNEFESSVPIVRSDFNNLVYEGFKGLSSAEPLVGSTRTDPERRKIHLLQLKFAAKTGDRDFEAEILERIGRLGPPYDSIEELRRKGTFAFTVEPPDADLYLFRYRPAREAVGDDRFDRLFPQPAGPDGAPIEIARAFAASWNPHESCTQVERVRPRSAAARAGVQPGDLLLDGAIWRDGAVHAVELPSEEDAGIDGFPTIYPLFAWEANRLARSDRYELPLDSYLLLFRREGYLDVRVPVSFEREDHFELRVAMDELDEVPPGFVRIEGGAFVMGGDRGRSYQSLPRQILEIRPVYVARKEITLGEYLDVLRWRESKLPGSMRDNLPSAAAGAPSPPWKIDPETFAVTPASHADLPLTYVTYAQAVRFTELLTARAEEEGEPWIYELPWAASWEKAARGADARIFAWGNEWDWLLAFGRHSWHGEKEGYPEIPESTFARLGDESPYGLFGMTGNVEEWVHLDDRESAHVSPGIKGGGFARADAMSFRLPRHVSAVLVPSSSTGFRLAARRKGMEKQGPLGDPLRWSRRDSEQ